MGSSLATGAEVAGVGSIGSRLATRAEEEAGLLTVSVISEAAIRSLGAIFGATGLANTDFAAIISSIPVSKISFFMSHFRGGNELYMVTCVCLFSPD